MMLDELFPYEPDPETVRALDLFLTLTEPAERTFGSAWEFVQEYEKQQQQHGSTTTELNTEESGNDAE